MYDYIDLLEKERLGLEPISHYKNIVYYIIQVGTGGTGSEIVRQLSQMLSVSNTKHVYLLADPDVVSEKNIRNQIFLPEDVHEFKADVLVERYSAAYPNLNLFSYTEKYIEDEQDLLKLINSSYLQATNMYVNTDEEYILPVLVGCIDNAFSRKIMSRAFHKLKYAIYLDVGNASTIVPKDWTTRDKEQWTKEELEIYNASGWSGQVVCGVKLHRFQQPTVTEEMLLDESDGDVSPSSLSCQELAASDPQRTIVNRFASTATLSYLSEIFEEKRITSHVTHFHAKDKYMRTQSYESLEDILKSTDNSL